MNSIHLKSIQIFFKSLSIEDDIITEASKEFQLIKIKPNTVLLNQGSQQKYGHFILSGILRSSYHSDIGGEYSKEYYFKNEMAFLYSSWLNKSPATYQISALNHSELIRVPLHLLDLKEWLPAKIALLQQQLLYKEDKEMFLLLKTPEERYLHLLEHSPEWTSSLNNIQLATYIGINPISLSRIKNRIKKR